MESKQEESNWNYTWISIKELFHLTLKIEVGLFWLKFNNISYYILKSAKKYTKEFMFK